MVTQWVSCWSCLGEFVFLYGRILRASDWRTCDVVLGKMTLACCFVGFARVSVVVPCCSCFAAPYIWCYFLFCFCFGQCDVIGSGDCWSCIGFGGGFLFGRSLSAMVRFCGSWVVGHALLFWR